MFLKLHVVVTYFLCVFAGEHINAKCKGQKTT